MFKRIRERYPRWKKWASWNLNGPLYKILVLLGFVKSPTFEMGPHIDSFLNDFEKTRGDIREGRL